MRGEQAAPAAAPANVATGFASLPRVTVTPLEFLSDRAPDVVLIAPQIRHLRKSIEKLAASVGKPVAMIEPFHYATMNGQAVLEQVLRLLPQNTQEGKTAT